MPSVSAWPRPARSRGRWSGPRLADGAQHRSTICRPASRSSEPRRTSCRCPRDVAPGERDLTRATAEPCASQVAVWPSATLMRLGAGHLDSRDPLASRSFSSCARGRTSTLTRLEGVGGVAAVVRQRDLHSACRLPPSSLASRVELLALMLLDVFRHRHETILGRGARRSLYPRHPPCRRPPCRSRRRPPRMRSELAIAAGGRFDI